MSKEIIVENIANSPKSIPGFPVFLPGELYRIDEKDAEKVLNCPFIEEVSKKPTASLETAEGETEKKVTKGTIKTKGK